jgi:hypothetical protein
MAVWYGLCIFGIFYGRLVYVVAILYILLLVGILCGYMEYFVVIGIFFGYLAYFVVIWYILGSSGIFFTILVCFTKKKLASPLRRF